ncbi:MAG: hypothetical protein RLZZ60_578 [Bacteroidota bacterium]|jgi:hypothetical protein
MKLKSEYLFSGTLSIVCTFVIFSFLSCNKEIPQINSFQSNINQENLNSLVETSPISQDSMEFASQTPNPYTLLNMEAALQFLIDSSDFECDFTKFIIRPTHKYIKFKPIDSIQNLILNTDSNLVLFDYPLDRKLIKGGTYYRDPAIPDGQPNYQWCCVPIEQSLPFGIPFEVISILYLPELDPNLVELYNTPFDGCINLLIDQSMKMTGNFDTTQTKMDLTLGAGEIKIKKSVQSPSKWAPKGIIKIFDDRLLTAIGLEGVKVRAHRWFETRESITNASGFYNIGQEFRYPVDYSIKWERGDFAIHSGDMGQAYFNGPHQKGDWNLNITRSNSGGASWLYGHVHRAALRYCYKDIGGLRRLGQKKFAYWVFDRAGGWHNHSGNQGVNYAQIARINGKKSDGGQYYTADEIYSTTIHETAHSTHLKIMNAGLIQMSQVSRKIAESYAIGVEWVITQIEYRGLGIVNYSGHDYYVAAGFPIKYGYQYWNSSISEDYTSLFIDLIDDYNQNSSLFSTKINDPVSGYSLGDIESYLKNVYGLTSLTTQLKANKPSSVSDAQIDELISNF